MTHGSQCFLHKSSPALRSGYSALMSFFKKTEALGWGGGEPSFLSKQPVLHGISYLQLHAFGCQMFWPSCTALAKGQNAEGTASTPAGWLNADPPATPLHLVRQPYEHVGLLSCHISNACISLGMITPCVYPRACLQLTVVIYAA